MILIVLLKALIIGILLGGAFMFVSYLSSPLKTKGGVQTPNPFFAVFRFTAKLLVFIALLILPFLLLKIIA